MGTNFEIIQVHMYLNCQRSQKDDTVPYSGGFLGWMPYDLELAGNSQMVSGQGHDMLSGHGQSIYQLYACDVSLLSYGLHMNLGQTGGWIKKMEGW